MRRLGSLLLCVALIASAHGSSKGGSADAEGDCCRELRENALKWDRERALIVEDRDAIARSCEATMQSVEENRKASDALIAQQKTLVQSALASINFEREALRKEREDLHMEMEALREAADAAARERDALLKQQEGLIGSLPGSDAESSSLSTLESEHQTGPESGDGDGGSGEQGLVPAGSEEPARREDVKLLKEKGAFGVLAIGMLSMLFSTGALANYQGDEAQSNTALELGRSCSARANGHENAALGDDKEVIALAEWATRMGITWGGWRFGDNGGGLRGGIVTAPMRQYSTVVASPLSAVISTHEGDDSPLPDTFIHPNVWKNRLSKWWNIKLALRVIYEKRLGPESLWAPYISTLPESYDNLLFWSDDQMKELQFSKMIQKARNERFFFESVAKGIAEGMPTPLSQEEFFWGLGAVHSRAYGADFGGGQILHLMCPLSDAINHDDSAFDAMAWHHELGQLELRTPYARSPGDDLWVSYGNFSNQRLLHMYGFVLETNQFDYIPVTESDMLRAHGGEWDYGTKHRILRYLMFSNALGLTLPLAHLRDKSRVFYEANTEELKLLGYGDAEMKMGGRHNEEESLLLYCRVLSLDSKHLRMGALRLARRLQRLQPLSAANERKAVLLLIRVLQNQEASMKTSLEEDEETMETMDTLGPEASVEEREASGRYVSALRFRILRKRMLRASVEHLRERLVAQVASRALTAAAA